MQFDEHKAILLLRAVAFFLGLVLPSPVRLHAAADDVLIYFANETAPAGSEATNYQTVID